MCVEGAVAGYFVSVAYVRAGGMRVSKKQENGPVEKTTKAPGKEKASAIASFAKTQPVGVLLLEVLSKVSTAGGTGYVPSGTSAYSSTKPKIYQNLNCP
ncbi:death-associated protein-like 1 [Patagioenas fasciata monilis]|uniref:Death-associated protein-like 1 n=1 Tax=Patagioenas fasciata monilis TaxID=372326 RepID=A0A1V4KD48_PATFA|nr:death-associated protein-like 1 [Patagioenas fasciata monilis]